MRLHARSRVAGGIALQPALDRRQRVLGAGRVGEPANSPTGPPDPVPAPRERSPGHHATTGVSGSRNGSTTLLACAASGPAMRSTTTSPAPASPPTRSWPSSRGSSATRVDRHHHDDPARVLVAGRDGGVDGVLAASSRVRDDHQRQHAAQRDRAALLAQRGDLLVDLVAWSCFGRSHDHGRRHSRPVRRNISNADSGPQVPDS